MPPKKISKIQENIDSEIPSRTLRPRKPAPPIELTKTKVKTGKAKAGDEKTKVTKGKRGGKLKSEKIEDEQEPARKRSKNDESQNGATAKKDEDAPIDAQSIWEFNAKDLNGQEVSLEKYKGHVCIIVNVASRCGHTASNYKEFVDLINKYGEEKGLRILAFPCNQFGSQEPGDSAKICEFAKKKNVNFDMFEKINVNGKNAHPLWKFLKSQKEGPKGPNIDWNFTKFLIDKEGKVVDRFKPTVKPLTLLKDLEKLW